MRKIFDDLLIVGGGPAGLSAAINAASEGLSVRILDADTGLGGQAKQSSGIENYPGFPEGITGTDLMRKMAVQAFKFRTSVTAPVQAMDLVRGEDGMLTVTDELYNEYHAKAVLLTMGLSYRRLTADNVSNFLDHGVYYGVPAWKPEKRVKTIAVIGGANSAGQAVCGLAKNPNIRINLMIRKTIDAQMSSYLIERIKDFPNVEVMENTEVIRCMGDSCLRHIQVVKNGVSLDLPTDQMIVFIGAMPRTMWLKSKVDCDDHHFIFTGGSGTPYMTSMPGVFAAGDVRSTSTKRIATAIGEGSAAVQNIHRYLGAL